MATYALSDEKKEDKLLTGNSLGDMKPSDMLAYKCGLEKFISLQASLALYFSQP